jgi:hypothetical protein
MSSSYRSITGVEVADEKALPTHIMMGGLPVRVPESERKPFDEKEEQVAACDLRNISKAEIQRRKRTSAVGFFLTVVGAAFFVTKDKEIPSRLYRSVMIVPIGLWVAFYLSAKSGICGMSGTGEWDPDSRGIRKAPREIAEQIWNKAKKVHIAQTVISLALTFAFYKSPI